MQDFAASVLVKLKKKANDQGMQFQQLLNLFCQEEFVRRLAVSKHRNKIILKGGFLIYLISEFKTRTTMDADYLLKNYSNDLQSIEILIKDIIDTPNANDFINFEIRNIEKISEAKEYNGVRVNLIGLISNTKTPFKIDFGVGDVIVSPAIERKLPTILPDFYEPKILTYPLESIVSEKLEAILSLMEATSRMKDFYDIYYLATSFNFDGQKLQKAIEETLKNRRTPYDKDSIILLSRLLENTDIQKRWNIFCKKILKYELDLNLVIEIIIKFTLPPFSAMINGNAFYDKWNANGRKYE